ncbi:MAG TPA: alkaline phosphatase family protein [Bryobacteraceae bacterium]|jgi:alkaline phosphatase D
MTRRNLLLLLASCCAAATGWAASRPTVLLISLDGFRYDYAEKYHATNILAFAKNGVRAKAMLPSFPTTTFPNHYTIATGLYPAHHGIVENAFWDLDMNKQFRFNDPKVAADTRFWGGTPLWVLAGQQGVTTASFFWPGSDYEVDGRRPTYWMPYDGKIKNETRIDQVVEWLKLPEAKRPHFITLYFSDVDHAGHESGPDSEETRAAVQTVDRALGDLFAKLKKAHQKIDIFIVSDHGMANVAPMIDLGKLANFDGVLTSGAGTDFKVYSSDTHKIDEIYDALTRAHDPRFVVYRRADIPARLHYSDNKRIGDLVVFSVERVGIGLIDPKRPPRTGPPQKGTHGFDLESVPEMRASFFAAGPDLKKGLVIDEFQNINIYPLIAKLLRLEIHDKIDGDVKVLAPILRKNSAQ